MKSFIVLIFIQICISLRKAFNINKALNYYRQLTNESNSREYIIGNEIKALQLMKNNSRSKIQKRILSDLVQEIINNNTIDLPLLKRRYKTYYKGIKKYSNYLNNTFNVKLTYIKPQIIKFYPGYLDEVEVEDADEEE